jgi:hypothetical protein
VIREAFAADLLRAAAFAHGMDQFDAIRVDDAEHRRRGQEGICPSLMGPEEAKEPGALGEVGKQRAIVSCQPPIKRTVADAFERMQEPQGDEFTRLQGGVGVFGNTWEMVIHLAE